MAALVPISPHPDEGTFDLYVHIKPANNLQDLSGLFDWLRTEFNAIPVLPNSFYISAENLYEENNADSFMADLTKFLGTPPVGTEIVICPTTAVHHLAFYPEDAEQTPDP